MFPGMAMEDPELTSCRLDASADLTRERPGKRMRSAQSVLRRYTERHSRMHSPIVVARRGRVLDLHPSAASWAAHAELPSGFLRQCHLFLRTVNETHASEHSLLASLERAMFMCGLVE